MSSASTPMSGAEARVVSNAHRADLPARDMPATSPRADACARGLDIEDSGGRVDNGALHLPLCATGSTSAPSLVAICLRAGWDLKWPVWHRAPPLSPSPSPLFFSFFSSSALEVTLSYMLTLLLALLAAVRDQSFCSCSNSTSRRLFPSLFVAGI
jgi:hypothetical protein